MFVFGLMIMIISFITYIIRKNLLESILVFFGSIFIYLLFVQKILPNVIFEYFNYELFFQTIVSLLMIYMIKYFGDWFLKTEVGHDISNLVFDIFPDVRFKLFALFFIGQIMFSNNFIINFMMLYYIARILKIDNILIFNVAFISLIVREIFNASSIIEILNIESTQQLINMNIIYLLLTMIISIIYISISTLFIQKDQEKTIFKKLFEDRYQLLTIIIVYPTIFLIICQIFNFNKSQEINSFIMLIIISILSRKYMINSHEYIGDIEKRYPFIFSILICIFNGYLILKFNEYSLIVIIIFLISNFYFISKYKQDEVIEDELEISGFRNSSNRFYIVITITILVMMIVSILISKSDINNSLFGSSILMNMENSFLKLSSPLLIILHVISYIPYMINLDIGYLLKINFVSDNIYILLYSISIMKFTNIIYFFIFKNLIETDDEQLVNGILGIITFIIINAIMLVLLVIIL